MWHAHMLNPLRYLEDTSRLFGTSEIYYEFPLSKMHAVGGLTCESKTSEVEWNRITNSTEPFKLHVGNESDPIFTNCLWCKTELVVDIIEYVMYRMRDGKLNCSACNRTYNAGNASAKMFLDEISDYKSVNANQIFDRGSCLREDSGLFDNKVNKEHLKTLFVPDLEARTYLSGRAREAKLKLHNCNWEKISEVLKEKLFPYLKSLRLLVNLPSSLFPRIVKSYKNILFSTFSLDLVAAVIRQRGFEMKMCSGVVDWSNYEVMVRAIKRYNMFIGLMGKEKNNFLVPTLDI
ncbi:hypothetical protein HK096_009973, partial [Nowakowskiella sp. JEL0078]